MAEDPQLAPTAVPVTTLKRLDEASLANEGLSKLLNFFNPLYLGFKADEKIIQLNIPFIQGEGDQINFYDLHLQAELPERSSTPPLSIADLDALVDEIVVWLRQHADEYPLILDTVRQEIFNIPLLRGENTVIVADLLQEDRLKELEVKVALLLAAIQRQLGQPVTVAEEDTVADTSAEATTTADDGTQAGAVAAAAAALVVGQGSATDQASGETATDQATESTPTQSPREPQVIVPDIPQRFQPQDWARIGPYEKQVYAYKAISVHSGFLYNQIRSYVYNVYGLDPAEYGNFPPYLEYELRQAIIQQLYQLNPEELKTLDRFTLGRSIFEKLILRNPRTLALIETHIVQNVKPKDQAKLVGNMDPLQVWAQASEAEKTAFARQIAAGVETVAKSQDQATDESNKVASSESFANLETAASLKLFSRGLVESDNEFIQSVQTVRGIEQTEALKIRHLVTSYIQTTGLDPEVFLQNRSAHELSTLFQVPIRNDLTPEELNHLKIAITAYWQYQLQQLAALTKNTIQPDKELVEAVNNNTLTEENLVHLAADTVQFDVESSQENIDPRLYAIASLVGPVANLPETDLTALRLQLRDLYNGNDAQVNTALSQIQVIQKAQQADMAAHLSQNLTAKDLSVLYHRSPAPPQPKSETGEPVEVTENYIERLSLDQRREIAESVLSVYTIQNAYLALNDYIDEQLNLEAAAAGMTAVALSEELAQDYFNQTYLASPDVTAVQRPGNRLMSSVRRGRQGGATARMRQLRQARQSFKRVATLGKTARALKAGSTLLAPTPAGLAGAAIGGLLGATGNKEAGDKIQTAITIGTIVGGIGSAIGGVMAALGPVAVFIGGAILGPAAFGAVSSALKGFGSLANSTFVQPVLGTGAAAGTPLTASGLASMAKPAAGLGAAEAGIGAAEAGTGGLGASAGAAGAGGGIIGNFSIAPVATVGAVGGTMVAAAIVSITSQATFLNPMDATIGTGDTAKLEITKRVSPSSDIQANQEITYTLLIRANTSEEEGAITEITVEDELEDGKIQPNSIVLSNLTPPTSCVVDNLKISCTLPDLSSGQTVEISYTARTLNDPSIIQPDGKTPIQNLAFVRGMLNGEELRDDTSNTANSDGAAIANASFENVSKLGKGWWSFYNYHPDYPNLFDLAQWQNRGFGVPPCTTNCPSTYLEGGREATTGSPTAMYWCTWNVVHSYNNAGRPFVNPASPGAVLGVGGMRQWFTTNGIHIENPTYQDIQVGDVAFFGKGDRFSAHVAIVGRVSPVSVTTYDSNNYRIDVTYSIGPDGRPQPLGSSGVTLNGVGRLR